MWTTLIADEMDMTRDLDPGGVQGKGTERLTV